MAGGANHRMPADKRAKGSRTCPDAGRQGQAFAIGRRVLFPAEAAEKLRDDLVSWLGDYFSRFPMRFGAPKKEVAQNHFPNMEQKQQRAVFRYLAGTGSFEQDDTSIWLTGWKPKISKAQEEVIGKFRKLYREAPFSPPLWSEAVSAFGIPDRDQGEYLQWFLRSGEMVRLSDNVVYTRDALERAEAILRENFPGGFTLAEARDILGTSRKYAQQSGYFDLVKVTYWVEEREKYVSVYLIKRFAGSQHEEVLIGKGILSANGRHPPTRSEKEVCPEKKKATGNCVGLHSYYCRLL